MAELADALEVAKQHIDAEAFLKGGALFIMKEITVTDLTVLDNRVDYRYIDASKEGVTKVAL